MSIKLLLTFSIPIIFGVTGCIKGKEPSAVNGSSDMVALLKEIARQDASWKNTFVGDLRVAHYDSLIRHAPTPQAKLKNQYFKAIELLHNGKSREAAQIFKSVKEQLKKEPFIYPGDLNHIMYLLNSYLGIAYMRLGEQENCLLNHSSASCIIPVNGEGIHQLQEGSQNAIQVYQEMLDKNPEDLITKWLFNIAHMTLGQYPKEVPQDWMIPFDQDNIPSGFKLEFRDIAMPLGIAAQSLSGGSVVEDFDGDGDWDILVSSWDIDDQIQYFENQWENNDAKPFVEKTVAAGLNGITGGLNMVHGDYNNDGFQDVLVLRGAWRIRHGRFPNSLLQNNGDVKR